MTGVDYERAVAASTEPLLAALVVAARPSLIVECGTYPGRSTRALLVGVRLAGRGLIDTYERDGGFAADMSSTFADSPEVSVRSGRPASFANADLAVIDSGPTYEDRAADLACWMDTAAPFALLIVDDINEPWFDAWRHRLGHGVIFLADHGVGVWRR